jgi:S-adenosylmethionine:tRNA ribosyltransferase-isomerase
MRLSEFDYDLPAERIAQHPLKDRDSSKLLVLHRKTGKLDHRLFRDIVEYFDAGDVLVLNNTRVIPSRIPGNKPSGGKAEITLLKELGKNTWEGLAKGVNEGTIILPHGITANVTRIERSLARIVFEFDDSEKQEQDIKDRLRDIGVMPLPVYIKRESASADSEGYQTVYASEEGAVAAPTAGLHFTGTLLNAIKAKGVRIVTVTLHVGYGTFKPVTSEKIEDHQMDEEYYDIPEAAASAINSARSKGRRIIAVGTTVTRTLESSAAPPSPLPAGQAGPLGKGGVVVPGNGKASIFIYPGYTFKIVDVLITNFHLPRSTPMMLASAFAGINHLKTAYYEAEKKDYRFFSYGDAMIMI